VKVLDFGIVRGTDDRDAGGPALSGENRVQGTPAYMAPEQAMGRMVDGRTDIYAAGCVAFWLLTGEPVFAGANPMGLLVDHAKTPPDPPSARTGRPIPAALDALVLDCLAKDPASRPQSARELSRRLAEAAGTDAWTQERAREWWQAHQPAGA
jgi:serine/threonine-protein kinase